MKRMMFTVLLMLGTWASAVYAFFPSGDIDRNYSYENLRIESVGPKTCWLRGTILNKTGKRREDVTITFYAMTIHNETLWKAKIRIDLIDRYGTFDFETKIKKCKETDPYKWEFKVRDRNK